MAKKYRFKKEFSDARIVLAGYGEEITKDNLTDEIGARISKMENLKHNIEEVGGEDEEETEVKKLKSQLSELRKENKELKAEIKELQKNAPADSQTEEPQDSSENVNEGQNL